MKNFHENFAIVKPTTGGLNKYFIAPKKYFKSRTEVYWPKDGRRVGKKDISAGNMQQNAWDLIECEIKLWLETERDAKKLLRVYMKPNQKDEDADVEIFLRLNGIKAAKPSPLIRSGKRKLEESPRPSTHAPSLSIKRSKSPSNDGPPAKIVVSSTTTKPTPTQQEMRSEKFYNDILGRLAELKSQIDGLENKVDACMAVILSLTSENNPKKAGYQYNDVDVDEEFAKEIEDSFPIKNLQTLERFDAMFKIRNHVSMFVKYMYDMFIKDSNITDGKKLVRNFIDHFFDRKFMLQVNRTGNRRSVGPEKISLEKYGNILKTFHKCIVAGVPSCGFEGTKKSLWRLCDRSTQRYRTMLADEKLKDLQREKCEKTNGDLSSKNGTFEFFDPNNIQEIDKEEIELDTVYYNLTEGEYESE